MLPTRDSIQNWRHTETESEGMEKDITCKWVWKKVRVAILISDKIDFKTKTVTRDKEVYYIIIKGTIQQEDVIIVNIYALNIRSTQIH